MKLNTYLNFDGNCEEALKPEEAEHLFNALSEKAEVSMPLAETFWALRFGMLVDQFGVPWMVNCEKKA